MCTVNCMFNWPFRSQTGHPSGCPTGYPKLSHLTNKRYSASASAACEKRLRALEAALSGGGGGARPGEQAKEAITVREQRECTVPYAMQVNMDFYTDEALAVRSSLRHAPEVVAALGRWWSTLPKSVFGGIVSSSPLPPAPRPAARRAALRCKLRASHAPWRRGGRSGRGRTGAAAAAVAVGFG